MIGGVIMTHGDEGGLILPPTDRAVSGRDRADPARQLAGDGAAEGAGDSRRAGRRAASACMLDDRDSQTPGWKFNEWELRGVPLRLEIGPKDIEKSQVVLARRDTREKSFVPMDGLAAHVEQLLDDDPAGAVRPRGRVPDGAHDRDRLVRRVQADHGGPPGIRDLALVRLGGVRGGHQGRDAGDDPEHPVRAARQPTGKPCLKCGEPATAHAWFAKSY